MIRHDFLRTLFTTLCLVAILSTTVAIHSAHAQQVETLLAVGGQRQFYCKINSLGFAQLFRSRPFAEVGLDQRIRAWERKKNNLIAKQSTLRAGRKSRRLRLRQLKGMINAARDCRKQNNPATACSIFTSTIKSSGVVALPIIDGSACFGNFSPVVKLDIFRSNLFLGSCSGTVVHANIIVTAAHCIGQGANEVKISNLNGQSLGAPSTILHRNPFYNGAADYDLAVVRTNYVINTSVVPIHKVNDMLPTEISAIAGYGVDENNSAGELKAGFFSILGFPGNTINARFLPGSGSNSCYGDSGGPALIFRSGSWRLVGAVSNGDNRTCGLNGQPDLSRWVNITALRNLQFLKVEAPELF